MGSFVDFYLENREEELRHKWKIIDFLMNNEKIIQDFNINQCNKKENYYSISRLKNIFKSK